MSKQWHLKICRFYLIFKVDPFNLEGCDRVCFILQSCHQEGVTVRNDQRRNDMSMSGCVNLKTWRELLWNVLSFYFPLTKHCRHHWANFGTVNEWIPNEWMGWIFFFFFQCFIFIYLFPPPPEKNVLIFCYILWCSVWLNVVLFLTESMCIFLLYKWRKCFQIHPSIFNIPVLSTLGSQGSAGACPSWGRVHPG